MKNNLIRCLKAIMSFFINFLWPFKCKTSIWENMVKCEKNRFHFSKLHQNGIVSWRDNEIDEIGYDNKVPNKFIEELKRLNNR